MALEDQILDALRGIQVPDLGQDLVTLGMIRDVKAMHGIVTFTVALKPGANTLQGALDAPIKAAVKAVPGVNDVAVHWVVKPDGPRGAIATGPAAPAAPAQRGTPPTRELPAGVKHIIAVGSGKGGVGKSTVTVNLALALAGLGYKVGVLDADIYGPSVPFLMGVAERKPAVANEKLVPIEAHGIKVMSMGFLLPTPDEPVVWRGPMLAGAMRQFFQDVAWGELDYLLVDLPPGTGDVPLSLVQLVPVTGAAIVLTPQPVAAAIGTKTLRMLQQSHAPILGIVENMSHFICGSCGTETDIFDRGGGRAVAEREGVPFLGEVPLDPAIRLSGDKGVPVAVAEPEGPHAQAFRRIAQAMVARLAALA